MKYSQLAVVWMLSMFIMLYAFACMYGWEELIEPNEGQPLVVDSCELQDIDVPNFRGIYCIASFPLPPDVTVQWQGYSTQWIKQGTEQAPLMQIIRELVSNYVTFDSMIILDKSSIENGVMRLDFACFFRNPSGNDWWSNGASFIQFRWEGYQSQIQIARMRDRDILFGSLATASSDEVVSIIHALPSWHKFNMRYASLDSAQCDLVWAALLEDCKTDATVDTTGLPISQDRIDQFIYQGIVLK